MSNKLILILVVFIYSCSQENKMEPTAEQISTTLNKFESDNGEVLKAIYNNDGVFNWVLAVNGISSTGSWKGYASAMCNTLYEVNILNSSNKDTAIEHGVRIVDARKLIDSNGNFREASLGSADCKTFQMNDI